jgi:hypothetical protein
VTSSPGPGQRTTIRPIGSIVLWLASFMATFPHQEPSRQLRAERRSPAHLPGALLARGRLSFADSPMTTRGCPQRWRGCTSSTSPAFSSTGSSPRSCQGSVTRSRPACPGAHGLPHEGPLPVRERRSRSPEPRRRPARRRRWSARRPRRSRCGGRRRGSPRRG